MSTITKSGIAWAGLAAGPGAWAFSTQANYALVPWICAHKINLVPLLALILAGVALVGAGLSWRSMRPKEARPEAQGGRPEHFLAGLGVFMGILFALVILTQGAAGLVLQGCER